MKVVKTHKSWALNKRGYPVAFRFQPHGTITVGHLYHQIIVWLKENRGREAFFKHQDESEEYRWATYTGRPRNWREPTPYFIGLKDESDVSIILLSVGGTL